MKIRLTEIKVAALHAQTIILLGHFVRVARASGGVDLRMQQPDIVKRVFKYAATLEDPDLLVLFMCIKNRIISEMRISPVRALAA